MTTIAADLALQRLVHRRRRIEQVILALRYQRSERQRSGAVPPTLDHVIADFSDQLEKIQQQLQTPTAPRKLSSIRCGPIAEGDRRSRAHGQNGS